MNKLRSLWENPKVKKVAIGVLGGVGIALGLIRLSDGQVQAVIDGILALFN